MTFYLILYLILALWYVCNVKITSQTSTILFLCGMLWPLCVLCDLFCRIGKSKSILIVAAVAVLAVAGCATSTTGKLTQTEGVVIPSVNAVMGTWSAYVQSGKANQAQINAVQAAYNVYYSAQLSAEAALIESTANGSTNVLDAQAASTAVTAAENSLTSLINQYTQP